jgi:hypothetical protein
MINGVDKTSFSPNSNNKTTSVAGVYQSIIQSYYLIKSVIFWSKFIQINFSYKLLIMKNEINTIHAFGCN